METLRGMGEKEDKIILCQECW